ncbi:MAG: DeoR/GlpR family DNA-binding transcription regulator [Candidatus Dormibacteria bacterium]|jgi:DeoR/GlpR family transcriptional regulator of sugar metabolism
MASLTPARARRDTITKLLEDGGSVSVSALTAQFGVTETSIRHDLTVLQEVGRLRRVRGGAVSARRLAPPPGAMARARENSVEKARIGRLAATLVHTGDVVLFDSGSTVLQVVTSIPPPRRITVVTHALQVMEEVGAWDYPHLICLGGLYLREHQLWVGPLTLLNLRDLTGDIAFLGCDGLTVEGGMTTADMLVAEVGAALAARARRVVVVADASKLGRAGFTPFVTLDAINVLVTDERADPGIVARIREMGIEVLLA